MRQTAPAESSCSQRGIFGWSRIGGGHHRHDEGRLCETLGLLGALFGIRRAALPGDPGKRFDRPCPVLPGVDDEPPRSELAVIGNAGRDGQHLGQRAGIRTRIAELRRGDGATCLQVR